MPVCVSVEIAMQTHSRCMKKKHSKFPHLIKWDHFDVLATKRSDGPCEIKETLIRDLQPALNENVVQ